jgi:hypothetical protein
MCLVLGWTSESFTERFRENSLGGSVRHAEGHHIFYSPLVVLAWFEKIYAFIIFTFWELTKILKVSEEI